MDGHAIQEIMREPHPPQSLRADGRHERRSHLCLLGEGRKAGHGQPQTPWLHVIRAPAAEMRRSLAPRASPGRRAHGCRRHLAARGLSDEARLGEGEAHRLGHQVADRSRTSSTASSASSSSPCCCASLSPSDYGLYSAALLVTTHRLLRRRLRTAVRGDEVRRVHGARRRGVAGSSPGR